MYMLVLGFMAIIRIVYKYKRVDLKPGVHNKTWNLFFFYSLLARFQPILEIYIYIHLGLFSAQVPAALTTRTRNRNQVFI